MVSIVFFFIIIIYIVYGYLIFDDGVFVGRSI